MAFYYVKSGGTATGDAGRTTTARTGSFGATSTYYDDIRDALSVPSTSIVAGDSIYCSHLHSFNNASSAISYGFPATGIPIQIISVNDAAQDSSLTGAKEETNSLIRFDGKSSSHGMTYDTSTSISCSIGNASTGFIKSLLNLTTSSDFVGATGDGSCIELIDTEIACSSTSNGLQVQGGGALTMFGGTITASTTIDDLLRASSGNGGGRIICEGVDLSTVTGFLLGNHGSNQTADDNVVMVINSCKLNASVGFVEETLTNLGTSILVTNSSSTSSAAEYQFYYEDYFGSVEDQDDSGIHRDESTAFSGGTKVSMKAVTKANASTGSSFSFDLHAIFAELSSASTDTIRVYFASTSTLTDNDVWVEMIYPDGTNKNEFNYITNQNADVIATGTTHTDDSGSSTWKDGGSDLAGSNEYRMDLDTSGNVGADGVPIIRVHIGKPSITVYFDTTVDVVA